MIEQKRNIPPNGRMSGEAGSRGVRQCEEEFLQGILYSARFSFRRSTVDAATWLITINLFRVDIERTAVSLSTVEKALLQEVHIFIE